MKVADTVEPVRRIAAVRPPLPGRCVCRICRGPARDGSEFCWCCRRVCAALGETPRSMPPVLPMLAFRPGDVWSVTLRRYKDAPVIAARRHFARLLTEEAERFLTVHVGCLEKQTGGFDSYCVVPTSRPQARALSRHPLEAVLTGVSTLASSEVVRMAPVEAARHLRPNVDAFVPVECSRVSERRVLLVDDSWVTGARALSAVMALRAARATVAGVVVIGRSVDPSASSNSKSWWTDLVQISRETELMDDARPCSGDCQVGPTRL